MSRASRSPSRARVRERALWLVTELTYQRTVEFAGELCRWPIGRGEIHRWVADEGGRLEAARAAAADALFGERPERQARPRRRGTGLGERRRDDGPRPSDGRFAALLRPWPSPA